MRFLAKVKWAMSGDRVDPSRVGALPHLEPTAAWAKGELPAFARVPVPRPYGMWAVEREAVSEGQDGGEVERAARALMEDLRPNLERLNVLALEMGARRSISIWWETPVLAADFDIPSQLLIDLASTADHCSVYVIAKDCGE